MCVHGLARDTACLCDLHADTCGCVCVFSNVTYERSVHSVLLMFMFSHVWFTRVRVHAFVRCAFACRSRFVISTAVFA